MESRLGKVIHYYGKIRVVIVRLSAPVRAGMTVVFRKGNTAFVQKITSMQINHEPVTTARKGQDVGIKVKQKAREGTLVFTEKATKKTPRKTRTTRSRTRTTLARKRATKRPTRTRR